MAAIAGDRLGENLGPWVAAIARKILEAKPHPEMGYRSCLALFRDVKRYDPGRVDAACRRALEIGAPTRQSVVAILRRGLERTRPRVLASASASSSPAPYWANRRPSWYVISFRPW